MTAQPPPIPGKLKPFDLPQVIRLLRKVTRPFPKAALFELADDGFNSVFEVLAGCIISIRTLDEVTIPTARALFAVARTPAEVAALSPARIDELIRTCSFHEAKAQQLHAIAALAVREYGGALPCDFAVLTSLRGVGPKCANLVLGIACNEPHGIAVDIHVHRVTNRWGIARASAPETARSPPVAQVLGEAEQAPGPLWQTDLPGPPAQVLNLPAPALLRPGRRRQTSLTPRPSDNRSNQSHSVVLDTAHNAAGQRGTNASMAYDRSNPAAPRFRLTQIAGRAGFTLSELLTVIAIMILVMAAAVPVFNVMTGARSLEVAQNTIASTLAQARMTAIAEQTPHGVAFYRDTTRDRVTAAIVTYDASTGLLELRPETDVQSLPVGVGIGFQHVLVANPSSPLPASAYHYDSIGHGGPDESNFFGVILFDRNGHFYRRQITVNEDSELGRRLGLDENLTAGYPGTGGQPIYSQPAFMLFELEGLSRRQSGDTPAARQDRAEYINDTGIVVLVNRYNGSLTASE